VKTWAMYAERLICSVTTKSALETTTVMAGIL
jgi:hypothetical protein